MFSEKKNKTNFFKREIENLTQSTINENEFDYIYDK